VVKRTIEISRDPCHLATKDEQLYILRRTEPPRPLPALPPNLAAGGVIPMEDIGVIMVDQRDTTYTHTMLAKLAEHGGAIVICGHDHHPVGMYLPLNTNSHLLARLDGQLSASKPRTKRLWQQIVTAKIKAQAANIAEPVLNRRLLAIAARVKSDDSANAEGVAAAAYWPGLFIGCPVTHPFRRAGRDRSASPPNALLDYGYAALRATVARAIVSAGLLPALGIKHIGRSNPFCLADDLMEPLRPLVDAKVKALAAGGEVLISPSNKAALLKVLAQPVEIGGEFGPLMVAVVRYVASFIRCLQGETASLLVPVRATGTTNPTARLQTHTAAAQYDGGGDE